MKWTRNDIVFINNPSQWYGPWYPSGILCLSGYLDFKGYKNIIIDSAISSKTLDLKDREKKLIEKIKKIKPKIICFSSTFKEFEEVTKYNKIFKKLNKKVITIVGGPQPTYRYQDYINNGFDFVGIGEGEVTLFEFIKEIIDKSYNWKKVSGLIWRNGG